MRVCVLGGSVGIHRPIANKQNGEKKHTLFDAHKIESNAQ